MIDPLDWNAVPIAEYRSVSQSEDDARRHNLALAADAVNGYVIEPGATFSFNETVGDTTTDGRYKSAPVIAGSEVDYAQGGGICQVSTALYIAALEADMEIVERHPHSMVTDYAPLGLDTTIDYGTLDLRLKNTTDHPMGIVAEAVVQEIIVKIIGDPLDEGLEIDATSKIISRNDADGTKEATYVVDSHRMYYLNGSKADDEFLYKDTYYVSAEAEAILTENSTDPTK